MSVFRDLASLGRRMPGRDAAVRAGSGNNPSFIASLSIAALAFLIIAAIFMYQLVYADRVYLGVSALGVDLGADTKAEARARLLARFDKYSRFPVTLRYAGKEWKATPAEIGLRFDVEKTVDAAFRVGREGNFLQRLGKQFAAWRGGTVVQPSFSLDSARQDSLLSKLARQIDQEMIDARVIVQPDLQVRIAPSQAGRKLNVDRTVALLERAFSALSTAPVDLVVEESQPRIVEAGAQEAKAVAEKMVSAPLALRYGDRSWTLQPKDIQGMVAFAPQDDGSGKAKLVASLDEGKLRNLITRIAGEIDRKPQNARFDYGGGKLTVIRESRDGLKLDVDAALTAAKSQSATDQRTVALPVAVIRPSVTAQDIDTLAASIREKIEEASTSYAGSIPERKHNVELAARRLHGVVVGPGEIFSFNDELGPSTIESGFQTAWGIILREGNMQTVPSEAGGICQVSTTLFQSVFWAGYQIEERFWHLYWIPRYGTPPKGLKGLDSTVDAPAVDFKFKNNTSSPILIQAKTDGNNITFALYGQKPTWQVKVDPPIIENVISASKETVVENDPTQPVGWSLWVEHAEDGFKSTIVRTVTDGNDVRTLRLVSEYRPSRNVLRVGTKPVENKKPDQQPQPGQGQQPPKPSQ